MKKFTITMMLIALMAVLVACGSKEEKAPETSGDANKEPETTESTEADDTEEAAGTVTISHKLGETEVPVNPEKVVVFDFGALDTMDELGVEVAGLPQKTVPAYLSQYKDDKYENLGSLKEPDFEKLNSMKPDVIFISGRQESLYDQFEEIAPTIFIGVDTANYMESFKENMNIYAQVFNKEDEMKAELEEIDKNIEDIKAKTAETDEKALIVLGTEGKVSAYGPSSRFGLVHDVFGFKPSDENLEVSTHGQNITFEYILEQNPDILFVIDRDTAIGNDSSVKESLENELVQKTNAFKNEKIVYLNGELWYLAGGGLQSFKEMVKEVEAGL